MILTYEIFATKESTEQIPEFEPLPVERETSLSFVLKEEMKKRFTYRIKVTADGGETYWTNEKVFDVVCGPFSANVIDQTIPTSFNYVIIPENEHPYFEID